MKLTNAKAKQMLDMAIEIANRESELGSFNDQYKDEVDFCTWNWRASHGKFVYILKGIEILAKVAKANLDSTQIQKFIIERSFTYKGVKFYQLDNGELND